MKSRMWGLLILGLVFVLALAYTFVFSNKVTETSITGYLGGEKIGLYENPEFKDYIKEKYGLTMDYRKNGSLAMVQEDTGGQDYLFPSSQLALEIFENRGGRSLEDDIVLNSPIVIYSWAPIVEALKNEGVVSSSADTNYIDMVALSDLMLKETSWEDVGLREVYGNILVDTTDPNESNSGNMFLGLLANSLNGGRVVDSTSVAEVKADLVRIYQLIGYMQTSSADLFNQYLRQGMGSFPMIAGYESQILEFSKQNPDQYDKVKDKIEILYPSPTVWSSHVYIALTEEGRLGLEALKDSEVQRMAWSAHGYRTVVSGTADPEEFLVKGVPEDLTNIIPLPNSRIMEELMEAVE